MQLDLYLAQIDLYEALVSEKLENDLPRVSAELGLNLVLVSAD